jgi:uracil permease
VSYSTGPGVVLVNRVASRYVVTCCGALLLAAAFLPKIASFLALVPAAVVGAALTTAMAGQAGAGFAIVLKQGHFTGRDTFVVGLPLMVGTLIGFLPPAFFESLPSLLRAFLGNGLVTGIVLVICLEHALLKPRTEDPGEEP